MVSVLMTFHLISPGVEQHAASWCPKDMIPNQHDSVKMDYHFRTQKDAPQGTNLKFMEYTSLSKISSHSRQWVCQVPRNNQPCLIWNPCLCPHPVHYLCQTLESGTPTIHNKIDEKQKVESGVINLLMTLHSIPQGRLLRRLDVEKHVRQN